MFKFYLKCLISLLLIAFNDTQYSDVLPPVPCPNYFQYFSDNSQVFGRIQIPAVSNFIELTVSFTQRQPLATVRTNRGVIIPTVDEIVVAKENLY